MPSLPGVTANRWLKQRGSYHIMVLYRDFFRAFLQFQTIYLAYLHKTVISYAPLEERIGSENAKGRLWLTARIRPNANPAFCKTGSNHPSAKVFPTNASGRQVEMYDPQTQKVTMVDICFATHHLQFDKKGILAMANRGPNSNGSQFFITTSTPHHLDGKHTIFGEVVSGYPVVEGISEVKTMMGNRPTEPVTLISVTVSDKAPRS